MSKTSTFVRALHGHRLLILHAEEATRINDGCGSLRVILHGINHLDEVRIPGVWI